MHSLELSYLSRIEIPAQLSAGISSLHALCKKSNPLLKMGEISSLPDKKHVHSSDAARKGYLEALDIIHQSRPPLCTETLLLLHEKVFHYLDQTGGHFKTINNVLFDCDDKATRKVLHTPPPASEIPEAMNKFINAYHQAIQSSFDPLLVIPLALMDFIFIHPFLDGNGRMFRLLSVLLLYDVGIESAHELNFDFVLQNSRGSGQKALNLGIEGWKEGRHNVLPWITYFVGAMSYAHVHIRPL